jgi:hypothetical protein
MKSGTNDQETIQSSAPPGRLAKEAMDLPIKPMPPISSQARDV